MGTSKKTSILAGFVFAAFAGLAACGGGDNGLAPVTDLGNFIVADAATQQPKPDFSMKQCVSSCTTDSQCQGSCPTESSGTACCDTQTNTCFQSTASICPAPVDMTVTSQY